MDHINPTWVIEWTSAPHGSPRKIRMVFGLEPPTIAARPLTELIDQAHSLDALRSVLDGFAEDHGLRIVGIYDQADHADPLGEWISVGLAPVNGS